MLVVNPRWSLLKRCELKEGTVFSCSVAYPDSHALPIHWIAENPHQINQDACHPPEISAYKFNRIWRREVAPMQVDTVEQNHWTLRSGLHGNGAKRNPHATLSPKCDFWSWYQTYICNILHCLFGPKYEGTTNQSTANTFCRELQQKRLP